MQEVAPTIEARAQALLLRLDTFEREILLECYGFRTPRPWGAAVGQALEVLSGRGLLTRGLRAETKLGRVSCRLLESQMKASLRCTTEELPDLKPPWIWIGSQDTGWIASFSASDHPYRVEASVIGDDGIQICASVDSHAFHAPLVVILAVAMANGVDITMVTKSVAGPKA